MRAQTMMTNAIRQTACGVLLFLATGLAWADVLYVHTDHLGTPRLATNEQGTTVWRNLPTTEPFGNSPVEEDPDGDATLTTLNPRFPGQYADKETNLNYNYFRDYDPGTGRYVQSDPIGLRGGINTYAYGGGSPLTNIDEDGLAYFAKRPLGNFSWLWLGTFSCNLGGWYDLFNVEVSHVHLFFEDGKFPQNIGYASQGIIIECPPKGYRCQSGKYNDCIMRKAVANVSPRPYCLLGKRGQQQYNCQNWAEDVRREYERLSKDPSVKCECGIQ